MKKQYGPLNVIAAQKVLDIKETLTALLARSFSGYNSTPMVGFGHYTEGGIRPDSSSVLHRDQESPQFHQKHGHY